MQKSKLHFKIQNLLIPALGILFLVFVFFYVFPVFRGEIAVVSNIWVGPVRIHLYGLTLAVGILAAWFTALRLAGKLGIEQKQVDNALLWIVIAGFLGARLYFVAFEWDYFRDNLYNILAIWQGGLSIFGAVIGGTVGAVIYARQAGVNLWRFLDLGFLVLPLAQAIGRWGNFFNQEAFGLPTDLPWKLFIAAEFRPFELLDYQYYHPTFLYESLWDLFIFTGLLYLLLRRQLWPGAIAGSYLILYPLGRFFIEELRLDSFLIEGIKVDQITALLLMIVGVLILVKRHEKNQSN